VGRAFQAGIIGRKGIDLVSQSVIQVVARWRLAGAQTLALEASNPRSPAPPLVARAAENNKANKVHRQRNTRESGPRRI
jgi:hypothetical protein